MTATNHVLSGALIGTLLPLPLALVVAFVSHFILDMLPHYGIEDTRRTHSRSYRIIVYSDTTIASLIALTLLVVRKWSIFAVAGAAYLPDTTWVYAYFTQGRTMNLKPRNAFMRFHRAIQMERPWGIYVEVVVAVVLSTLLYVRLRS